MSKKKRKQVFGIPEHEHTASQFQKGADGYDVWAEIDRTWKKMRRL